MPRALEYLMTKLFTALSFLIVVACAAQATSSSSTASTSPPATAAPVLEAASGVCPVWAPKCCGLLRSGGVCVGNCVAWTAQCP